MTKQLTNHPYLLQRKLNQLLMKVGVTPSLRKKVLKFSSDFKADNGPDLLVYLSENEVQSGGELDPFVSLGKLKSNSGEQIYSLPDDVSNFKSVVIFCRAFNAPFGATDL